MNPAKEREPEYGNAKMKISRLPFSGIPGQSRLFLDYSESPDSLKTYFPNAAASPDKLVRFVPQVLENYTTDRGELCNALLEINTAAGAGPETLKNIEVLRESDAVAVLTGQQAGLFTGPLYTIYKALSAIKMAEELREYGIKAVPVFWVATEDHDFEEVAEAWFLDAAGRLEQTTYRPAAYAEGTPVGNVRLDDKITGEIDALVYELPNSEFSNDVRSLLSGNWKLDAGFGAAFISTLTQLLGRYGLIMVDPLNARIKQLSSPIYVEGIQNTDKIVEAIIARNTQLAADGYHSQVLVENDYFPLFWIDDDGSRVALRKISEGRYRIKGEKREFLLSGLEDIAIHEPTRFSPGVMFRPVVQDFLFPTVCYFGGGAEIAYFAQNSVVYSSLGRPVTPILHRQSFTIVEPRQKRSLEKLGIELPDLFAGSESVGLRSAGNSIALETARIFAEVEERINSELNRLDQELSKTDITLAANLAKRRRKIIYHIGALKKKTILAKARLDDTFHQRLESVFAALLPNGGLQERSLNVFSFVDRYGPNFINWVYDAIDLTDKEHRIIEL